MTVDAIATWRRRVAVLASVAALAVGACRPAGDSETDTAEPFTLEAIEGTDVSRVVFTGDAAQRIALETTRLTHDARLLRAPASAVWIDVDGVSWVYTNPAPGVFVRAEVTVAEYDRRDVLLSDGPPAGTAIVTVGVAELIGAEFGI